jgi:methanogenic corrinoid protein MtbC1
MPEGSPVPERPSASLTVDALRHDVDRLLADHDRPGTVAECLHAVESGAVDIPTLYHDVLVPAIKHVGQNWQYGRMRVWEEHLASATVRTVVEALYPQVQRLKAEGIPDERSVLLACVVDERHELGLRMLADVFDIAGWTTYYLGADTPTIQIEDAAVYLKVDLVVLASVTLFDRLQTRHVLDNLYKRIPDTRVVVACGSDVCADTGLRPEELFRAKEFLGPVHPDRVSPDASATVTADPDDAAGES